jgi:hypothetical protein
MNVVIVTLGALISRRLTMMATGTIGLLHSKEFVVHGSSLFRPALGTDELAGIRTSSQHMAAFTIPQTRER